MLSSFFTTEHDPALILSGVYNGKLVALSICTAIFASYFTVYLLDLAQKTPFGSYRKVARVTAAVLMSGGIWSMHFIGMLAFSLCTQISYDPTITFLSFLPALLSCLCAIFLLSHKANLISLSQAAVLLGAGIGTMHYSGMAAMELAPLLRYDPVTFALSIVVAVGLSFVGLFSRFYLPRFIPGLSYQQSRLICALVLGLAVSGMHYMGMLATRFISTGKAAAGQGVVDSELSFIAISVACATVLLTAIVAAINWLVRYRLLLAEKSASESRMSAILSTAVDGIITIDHRGRILSANRSAEKILGYTDAELIGQSAGLLTSGGNAQAALCQIDDSPPDLADYIGRNREVTIADRQGRKVSIRLGLGKVQQPTQTPLYVAFITDLTEQKKLQQSLLEKEQQYRSLMNNLPGVAFRCQINEQWSMIFASPSIAELTGFALEDFLSRKIEMGDLICKDDEATIEAAIGQAIANKTSYSLEYRITHRNGHTLWVLDQGCFTFDDDGQPLWIDGVLIDITERHEYEEQLKMAKTAAEQAAQAKQAFLANMSHEIRTPMNAIIGFSEILMESPLEKDQQSHLATINHSARSLMHLLNDILDSAKLEKGKLSIEPEHFAIRDLLDTLVSTFWLNAKQKGIDLQLDIAPDVAEVYYGDANRIRQVLTNLIGNAVKFTERGSVMVRVNQTHNDELYFAVEDTGIGIEQERIDAIFHPFEQADNTMTRRFGGTGLGTSISKQLVELMGGQLAVISEPDKGSRFFFSLPLARGDASQLPSAPTDQLVQLPPLNILVVDDIEQNLELLSLLLSRHNHRVMTAANGLEALAMFAKNTFDVILMDIHMPECDGILATQRIREREAHTGAARTPIIALTASVLQQDKITAQQAGMDGFATKPVNPSELNREIANVLGLATDHPSATAPGRSHTAIDFTQGELLWGSRAKQLEQINEFFHAQLGALKSLCEPPYPEPPEAKAQLHALKGVSGNLGLTRLSQLLATLESTQDKELYQRTAQQILDETGNIRALLNDNRPEAAAHAEPSDSLPPEALAQITTQLLQKAERAEVDETLLHTLQAHSPVQIAPLVAQAIKAFEEFEFSAASEQLSAILSAVKALSTEPE
ncbi:MHYT domain-containing protein [Gilvimarinus algae]|uniref:histidine kinase n=1 Tax=Gilvimarinus algae TaxID=3058037 RepID=A0ABT8T929_9GAMM|nr:MHYT domain-containing protein [Gilvimarinus sp. SDUM040014]MDO3380630.1 MHYT domain-containing protein [Gilvimarinus sp. SDUM040014]